MIIILISSLTLYKMISIAMQSTKNGCLPGQESLTDTNLRKDLPTRFLHSNLLKRHGLDPEDEDIGYVRPDERDYVPICLQGRSYTIISRSGAGEEGVVYRIKDNQEKLFALKVYDWDYKDRQKGDLIAMQKTHYSRPYLNIPLSVNREHGYSIFPILEFPYKVRPNIVLLSDLEKKVASTLAQDHLSIGDNWNEDNYMYDENYRLWRIDFGSLQEMK